MSRHDAVVVEPQELDYVAHVGVVVDPPGGRTALVGEDGVRCDAMLLDQLLPLLLREAEVRGMVAVEMTDLPAASGATPARP